MADIVCNLVCVLALCCAYSKSVGAERAPTWDRCNCQWLSWTPWSSCTKTCGGGEQERSRKVQHKDVPECDGFEKCGTPGSGWDYQACNTHCFNAGVFRSTYGRYGYCECPTGKRGTCCEQVVTCGTPSTISHGAVTGTDYTYNNRIQYTCGYGYNFTDVSQSMRTCTAQGSWSGSLPRCEYAISCTSNPCKNGASCVNTLGDYSCLCEDMWTGKNCDVDIQPPEMLACPVNRTIFVSTMTNNQSWTEPKFHDPHGFEVVVTKNYPVSTYEFPWGVHTVQYTAVKPTNGLSAECTFKIAIKPHPCPHITPPIHGLVVCNGWMEDLAQVCKIYCLKGFSLPPGYDGDVIVNCGATGQWIPQIQLQECVPADLFGATPGKQDAQFIDCVTSKTDIGTQYISDLKKSQLNALCMDHPEGCIVNNTRITCHTGI